MRTRREEAKKLRNTKAPVKGLSRQFFTFANRDESNLGVPKGIRTPVTTVKGSCPRPLDDGDLGASNSFANQLLSGLRFDRYPQILRFGGDKRDRTADLLHAMQALSQLSYTPNQALNYSHKRVTLANDEEFFSTPSGCLLKTKPIRNLARLGAKDASVFKPGDQFTPFGRTDFIAKNHVRL
jgi:hypothetical protein